MGEREKERETERETEREREGGVLYMPMYAHALTQTSRTHLRMHPHSCVCRAPVPSGVAC